jgi:hypothetical protein
VHGPIDEEPGVAQEVQEVEPREAPLLGRLPIKQGESPVSLNDHVPGRAVALLEDLGKRPEPREDRASPLLLNWRERLEGGLGNVLAPSY